MIDLLFSIHVLLNSFLNAIQIISHLKILILNFHLYYLTNLLLPNLHSILHLNVLNHLYLLILLLVLIVFNVYHKCLNYHLKIHKQINFNDFLKILLIVLENVFLYDILETLDFLLSIKLIILLNFIN